jgi:Nucleoside-diphosphate-sugar pyrophosphorylase involved in lipopolysaccharide biosynthesis/translation initiation factor 2B, gamma/epsilon subunits (eIF-2Bgamma/eIF-2Bepsilon)
MRQLTDEEITILEDRSCWAEDWTNVHVSEDFKPNYMHRVMLYGQINIGAFDKNIEVSRGFLKHSGINNATLRNVTVGDNCLIENIGSFINNYTIGDDCHISNVSSMETTEGATYGEGNLISVLNEVGDGNVILFSDLNSQFAAFMVKHFNDRALKDSIRRLINEEVARNRQDQACIGNNVKIVNTKEITNTVINDDCEINGAARLSDCTILSSPNSNVYIGTGVICENSIISEGSSIINSVKMQDCFVGEACQISNGFTASSSIFFANSYMSNGEACAAFCGPFTASHHKSSLLIGGMFSFYNAGSATNFSNHAYKMGPMHYGVLERGTKTASGAYVLMPANIGTFSVCFGKLMYHPDTRNLPFSYLIAYGDTMYLSPGRNITTVGLYRDIRKWPKRDVRAIGSQKSIVNFDWLSPFSVGEILEGKAILEKLLDASGTNVTAYTYHNYVINAESLNKGIKYYDIALRIYMGAVLKRVVKRFGAIEPPTDNIGLGKWNDLSGLLLPESEEYRLLEDIKSGDIETIQDVIERFEEINDNYREYQWTWTYKMILDYYKLDEITEADVERIRIDYVKARRAWIAEIKKDAEKEYAMGDVEEHVLDDFINNLDHEIDFEN